MAQWDSWTEAEREAYRKQMREELERQKKEAEKKAAREKGHADTVTRDIDKRPLAEQIGAKTLIRKK